MPKEVLPESRMASVATRLLGSFFNNLPGGSEVRLVAGRAQTSESAKRVDDRRQALTEFEDEN